MKRVKNIFCLILCVLVLSACNQRAPEFLTPVNFYYCNRAVSYHSPAGVISSEVREASVFQNDINKFMEAYLQGPASDELYTIIPVNTVLQSSRVQGAVAQLHFSEEFAELSGIKLTTASICLVKSLNEFIGVETIIITAEDSLLDEKESFTISMEDIVTMDTVTEEE